MKKKIVIYSFSNYGFLLFKKIKKSVFNFVCTFNGNIYHPYIAMYAMGTKENQLNDLNEPVTQLQESESKSR